jgi:hypothetical protein
VSNEDDVPIRLARDSGGLHMRACRARCLTSGRDSDVYDLAESVYARGDNQGWWSATVPNTDGNTSYFVGSAIITDPSGEPDVLRNFFSFDLSSACRASGVTLRLTRFVQTGPWTYSLFDVSTPAATLNANNGTSQTIFDDLGSGVRFGGSVVPEGERTDVLSFPLNAAGVAAFNVARGGFFSLGGSIPGPGSVEPTVLFGSSEGTGVQQLVATCALPETTDQCKKGGWRNFPGFKNQGHCVRFIATGGTNPPAGS